MSDINEEEDESSKFLNNSDLMDDNNGCSAKKKKRKKKLKDKDYLHNTLNSSKDGCHGEEADAGMVVNEGADFISKEPQCLTSTTQNLNRKKRKIKDKYLSKDVPQNEREGDGGTNEVHNDNCMENSDTTDTPSKKKKKKKHHTKEEDLQTEALNVDSDFLSTLKESETIIPKKFHKKKRKHMTSDETSPNVNLNESFQKDKTAKDLSKDDLHERILTEGREVDGSTNEVNNDNCMENSDTTDTPSKKKKKKKHHTKEEDLQTGALNVDGDISSTLKDKETIIPKQFHKKKRKHTTSDETNPNLNVNEGFQNDKTATDFSKDVLHECIVTEGREGEGREGEGREGDGSTNKVNNGAVENLETADIPSKKKKKKKHHTKEVDSIKGREDEKNIILSLQSKALMVDKKKRKDMKFDETNPIANLNDSFQTDETATDFFQNLHPSKKLKKKHKSSNENHLSKPSLEIYNGNGAEDKNENVPKKKNKTHSNKLNCYADIPPNDCSLEMAANKLLESKKEGQCSTEKPDIEISGTIDSNSLAKEPSKSKAISEKLKDKKRVDKATSKKKEKKVKNNSETLKSKLLKETFGKHKKSKDNHLKSAKHKKVDDLQNQLLKQALGRLEKPESIQKSNKPQMKTEENVNDLRKNFLSEAFSTIKDSKEKTAKLKAKANILENKTLKKSKSEDNKTEVKVKNNQKKKREVKENKIDKLTDVLISKALEKVSSSGRPDTEPGKAGRDRAFCPGASCATGIARALMELHTQDRARQGTSKRRPRAPSGQNAKVSKIMPRGKSLPGRTFCACAVM
ncbi:glutamic acid-rich protein-like [Macrosteles quadrilineatus]|uniref:glutamic acid-rich protein-like n=1 Tax=Macrosteles quadrilineatus TaxID=74068 RepID=UPI0023E30BFF|nr:glutamic acid-rich protein-like [Macrosteles quadrilineatus]